MSEINNCNPIIKEHHLSTDDAQSLFYDRMNRYLKFVQSENHLERSGDGFPREYLDNYAEAKSDFLIPEIFKDKFTYEKEINLRITKEDILKMGYNYELKDNRMINIYNNYTDNVRKLYKILRDALDVKDSKNLYMVLKTLYYLQEYWLQSSFCDLGESLLNTPKAEKIDYVSESGEHKSITIQKHSRCAKVANQIIGLLENIHYITPKIAKQCRGYIDQIGGYGAQLEGSSTLKGTLCISIDPFEFITCSDNSLGWNSCFSMMPTGCNYVHSLSMLTAHNVFLAYLKTDKPYRLIDADGDKEDNLVSNKMIRAWVFADENTITVDKNYPIQNLAFSKEIVNFVNELTNNKYSKDVSKEGIPAYFNLKVAYDDGPCKLMSTTENFKVDKSNCYSYNPSDCAYCFCCGNQISCGEEYYDDNGFWCDNCLDICECDSCGERYHRDSLIERENGDLICPGCYDELEESEREGDAVGISEDNYD
jgi:hypothetical protein